MPLKAVLKLDLHDEKDKKAALKIAAGFAGINLIMINMTDSKLTVTGDFDPVHLVGKLRKLFPTELMSVGPAKDEKKGNDQAKTDNGNKKRDVAHIAGRGARATFGVGQSVARRIGTRSLHQPAAFGVGQSVPQRIVTRSLHRPEASVVKQAENPEFSKDEVPINLLTHPRRSSRVVLGDEISYSQVLKREPPSEQLTSAPQSWAIVPYVPPYGDLPQLLEGRPTLAAAETLAVGEIEGLSPRSLSPQIQVFEDSPSLIAMENLRRPVGVVLEDASNSQAHLLDLNDLALLLRRLLQQPVLTESSFSELENMLSQLEGMSLPFVLGSVYTTLKTDFWHSWEEYEEAHIQRNALTLYLESPPRNSLSKMAVLLDHQNREAAELQTELAAVDLEIVCLQARREALNDSLAANRYQADEIATRIDRERRRHEECLRLFASPRASITRIRNKENLVHMILEDLDLFINP